MRLRGASLMQVVFYFTLLVVVVLLAARIIPIEEVFSAVDWRLLALLGSFMLLADGLKTAGLMDRIASAIARRARSPRGPYLMALTSAFLLAMLVTNDAALFAVVPFTIALARRARLHLRRLVIYEIMAVNLGSAFTPWGNPQNLFLYHSYHLSPFAFFQESAPFAAVSALFLLVFGNMALAKKGPIAASAGADAEPRVLWGRSGALLGIFVLLVLSVLRLVPVVLSTGMVVLYTGLVDRAVFRRLDWWLLGTFLLLFPAMSGLGMALARALGGGIRCPLGVYGAGIGTSQVISNVPAAMLLSHATGDWRSLYYGVNLGGLGTALASFANLIGLSLYLRGVPEDGWREFLVESLGWNALLLIVLGGAFVLFIR